MAVSLDMLLRPAEHPEVLEVLAKRCFVGIDFGTSNTTVTLLRYDEQGARLLAEPFKIAQAYKEEGGGYTQRDSHIVPTVIAYERGGERLLFGGGAKALLVCDPDHYREGVNVWTEFKMAVGTQEVYPWTWLSRQRLGEGVSVPAIETPHDAARAFFGFLREQIEAVAAQQGKTVAYLVTVPASFAQAQREGLLRAVHEAGIDLQAYSFLDEPNGAFIGTLAYLVESGRADAAAAFTRNEHFLVFDFGAGTCDISVLRLSAGLQITNLGLSHFTALGGRDVDRRIAEAVLLPKLLEGQQEVHERTREGLLRALAHTGERLKCRVCEAFAGEGRPFRAAAEATLEIKERPFEMRVKELGATVALPSPTLSSRAFAELMEGFCAPRELLGTQAERSIFEPVEDALSKAGLRREEVDMVILVGGSAKNPFVKERLRAYFGSRVGLCEPGDICSLVSRGAAVYALFACGLQTPLITPILNDDIRLVAENDDKVLLYRAGTSVPQARRTLGGQFHPQGEGRWFKIPIYIGEVAHALGEIRFRLPHADAAEGLRFSYELSESKVLRYWLEGAGREPIQGELEYPTGSAEQAASEQALATLRNQLERKILANGGHSPVAETRQVAEVFAEHGKFAAAADMLWQLYGEGLPEEVGRQVLEQMADWYRAAGLHRWELEVRERLFKLSERAYDLFYLVAAARNCAGTWDDARVGEILAEAARRFPEDTDILRQRFFYAKASGAEEEANAVARQLFDFWSRQDMELMQDFILREFATIAKHLGKEEVLGQIGYALKRCKRAVRPKVAFAADVEEASAESAEPKGSLLHYTCEGE